MKRVIDIAFNITMLLVLYLSIWGASAHLNIQGIPEDFMEAFWRHKEEMRAPYVFLGQAIHESDWFSSDIYVENHNAVGMKFPSIRPTTAKRVNRGHATYTDIEACVQDYILWQNYNLPAYERRYAIKVDTDEEYLDFLRAYNYAEDKYYKGKVFIFVKLMRAEIPGLTNDRN